MRMAAITTIMAVTLKMMAEITMKSAMMEMLTSLDKMRCHCPWMPPGEHGA